MFSDVFTITPRVTSEGRVFCICGSICSTFSEMATELAPDCFCTMIIAPCSPE